MSRIAVDVVLLPEEAMAERAIWINTQLVAGHGSGIVLDAQTCLPHVTLAMGCIERDAVETVGASVEAAAGEHPLDRLVVTGVVTSVNARGELASMFAIARTQPIQTLHEHVTETMQEYFTYDVRPQMIYGDEDVAESTLAWIRTFREKSSFGAFFPHITLGYGPVTEPMTFPMEFKAARLALCHLGNHCTCRKVLASVDL